MRKELVLVLAMLFVLASCSETGTTTGSAEKSFVGGTTGLLVNFVEGEPPESVADGGAEPFTVLVKLENKGETLIAAEDVTLTLKGFDPVSFGLPNADALTVHPDDDLWETQINPDTGATIDSSPIFVSFPEMNYVNELAGNSVFPMVMDVCYVYQTRATSQICINENLQDRDNPVCTVAGQKAVQNSGSPIQIIAFEEYPSGDNIRFQFTIKDLGNGLLSALGSDCDESHAYKDYVTVTVNSGMNGLSCTGLEGGSGQVRLGSGEAVVRCSQTLSESDRIDKIMVVDITADFEYRESKSTNLLVKHI